LWNSILNIAGVAAGFYISWRAGYFWLGTIFLLVSGLLYFYSASYKRQFLLGNLIVSVLTSMVPFMVVLFEWSALYRYYSVNAIELPDLGFLFNWVGGFSLFAFLTTLIREIIKDTEDFEGDTAYGRNTIPVIIGITASKIVAISLIIITIVSLFLVWHFFVNDNITLVYISAAIVVPLLYVIYLLVVSTDKVLLHRAATIMKIVMLAGILYSLLVKAIITWNLV
jgi:4-hydroxybenzoate polyprenyltransferase